MTTPIKIKRSGTTTSTPSSLDHGELAINYADAKLFWKDATNTIRSFVFQAYASATHKSQHATGGSDALSPSDIGAAALSGATFTGAVEFDSTVANSVAAAVVVDGNFSTTSNAEVVTKGVFSDVRKTVSSGVTDSGKLFGGQFDAIADGAGTLADAYGVYARAVNLGDGTLTTATAIYAHVIGGTTGYGVYIAAGSATTSWGVYQAGTEKNYFGGNVGIGVSPTSALHVNGTVDCDGLIVGTTTASATGISLLGAADAAAARTTLGAAPAASPTFTGTVTVPGLTSTGVILADDAATANSVVYSFDGDPNTGIGRAGADVLTVVTNGSERVRVTSGGTLAVTTNLEIHGGATAFPTADTSAFIGRTDATGSAPFDQAGSLVYRPRVSSTAGRSSHIFYTGSPSVERLRINETGAAIFSGVITVAATSGSAGSYAPSLTFSGDANTGFGQVSGESDTASIFTAGSERVRVDSSGNIEAGPNKRTIGVSSRMHISADNANWGTPLCVVCDSVGRGPVVVSADYSPNPDVGSQLYFNASTGGFTIGCSSPGNSALGSVTFSASQIVTPAGTAAAPAIVASGDSNTGAFFPAADTFAISTAGSERVRVKSTGAVRFVPLSADPASGEAGDVYYNSSTNKLRVYNGTSWIDLH